MDGGQRGGGQPAGAGHSTKQVPPFPEGHLGGTSQVTGDSGLSWSQGWTNGGGLSEAGCHGHRMSGLWGGERTVHAKASLLPNPRPKDRFSLCFGNFPQGLRE